MSEPWIIDLDFVNDGEADGLCGPAGYTGRGHDLTKRFRMRDDDGEVYYEGRCRGESFAPLDDFGRPGAGCTTIEYQDGQGRWRAL